MQDNFLFGKHQTIHTQNKKAASFSFSFVFLSLILTILSFFIYLVYSSSFEDVKIEAAKSSLHSSFNSRVPLFQKMNPSNESNNIVFYYQGNIQLVFPSSQIYQDLADDEVSILIDSNLIFEKTTAKLTPHANILFNQIKSLLNTNFVKEKYVVDFVLSEDLTYAQNYPVFNEITTERVQQIREKLQNLSVPENIYGVGIEKGDKPLLKIHFYKGR